MCISFFYKFAPPPNPPPKKNNKTKQTFWHSPDGYYRLRLLYQSNTFMLYFIKKNHIRTYSINLFRVSLNQNLNKKMNNVCIFTQTHTHTHMNITNAS